MVKRLARPRPKARRKPTAPKIVPRIIEGRISIPTDRGKVQARLRITNKGEGSNAVQTTRISFRAGKEKKLIITQKASGFTVSKVYRRMPGVNGVIEETFNGTPTHGNRPVKARTISPEEFNKISKHKG